MEIHGTLDKSSAYLDELPIKFEYINLINIFFLIKLFLYYSGVMKSVNNLAYFQSFHKLLII